MPEITISRVHLRDLTTMHKRVAGRHHHLAALECVDIRAEGGVLTVSSTDLKSQLRTVADVERRGETFRVLVDVKSLHDTLGGKAEAVTLVHEGDTVSVINGSATTVLQLVAVADFPKMPSHARGEWHEVDADALARVAVAASKDTYRPALTGVLLDTDGFACATDSYRIHFAPVAPDGWTDAPLIVPAGVLTHVLKGVSLHVAREGERVAFRCMMEKGPKKTKRSTRVEVTCNVVDGVFPNWRRLIPETDYSTAVTFGDPSHLADTVRAWHKKAGLNVPVVFSMGDTVEASCEGSRSTFSGGTAYGAAVKSAYNGAYLADAIDAAGPDVTALILDELKPTMFVGETVTALLMPVRISEE